ncbi:MAG TPA: hypothetical protein VFJ24_03950 [Gaiellales bacterium]|nr:hypothetical protein [Gaiellales bacterium]
MTRAAQVTQAVSAMRKARVAPNSSPEPASLTFLIYEDNAGGYHWTIVADGGEALVRSASFASSEEAEQAARIVHRGASRASFEDRSGDTPSVDLLARRDAATARDRLDAERWLDEGGSFSSETVTR